ncbi:hypothetical protein [Cellulomonas soli]
MRRHRRRGARRTPALLLGLVAGAVPLAVIAARAAVVRDPDTLLPALAGAGAAVRVRA